MRPIDCPSCSGTTCADGIEREFFTGDVQPCPDCDGTGVIWCVICYHAAVGIVGGLYLCQRHLSDRLKLRIVA